MPIPDFDHNHVIPPHLGDPSKGGDVSPFECTTLELCQKFSKKFLNKYCRIHLRVYKTKFKTLNERTDYELLEIVEI